MELRTPIIYMDYDKISDDIYQLDKNCVVRFNVNLSKMNEDKRRFFHYEYRYKSRNKGNKALITIRRSYDYFLTIENIYKDNNGNKEYIIIGPDTFMLLKFGLREVYKWFSDSKYSKLFMTKKGQLIMSTPIPEYTITGLSGNKYLRFVPCIISRGEEYDKEPGVEIELSSQNNIVRMTLQRFMGMYYVLSDFNMVLSAQMMLSYMGRPEFGTNMTNYVESYEERTINTPNNEDTIMGRRRKIMKEQNIDIKDLGDSL